MKFVSAIFAFILLLIGNQFGFSQGFQNLDFENATIVNDPQGSWFTGFTGTHCSETEFLFGHSEELTMRESLACRRSERQ